MKLPDYDELPIRKGAPTGSAWGVFGDDDELGILNLLTPQRVREATAEVRSGRFMEEPSEACTADRRYTFSYAPFRSSSRAASAPRPTRSRSSN